MPLFGLGGVTVVLFLTLGFLQLLAFKSRGARETQLLVLLVWAVYVGVTVFA